MVRVSWRKFADFTPIQGSGKRRHLTANRPFYALLFDHAPGMGDRVRQPGAYCGTFGAIVMVRKVGTLGFE